MSSDKKGRSLSPEEQNDGVIIPHKTEAYREAVRDDLDTSTRQNVIKEQRYIEQSQEPISRAPAEKKTQETHRRETRRRQEETLDSIKFDGDIDLDREKTRQQLGFRDEKTYSNAERFSHKNDVKEMYDPDTVRYGTVEEPAGDGVIKIEDRRVFAESIKDTIGDSMREGVIKPSRAAIFVDDLLREKENEEKGIVKTFGSVVARQVEDTVREGGRDGDLTDRAKGEALKDGYKTGKYTAMGSIAIGQGASHVGQYGKRLSEDVAAGVMTTSAAKEAFLGETKSAVTGVGITMGGIIKTGAIEAVEDFHGSDDLGMQAITAPKDFIFKTKRSLTMTKSAGGAVSKGVEIAKKGAEKVGDGAKAVYAAGKKALTNPVALKGSAVAVVGIMALLALVAISSILSSVVSAFSLKSGDRELSETYLYITELDAKMSYGIANEEEEWHFPEIDSYRYYLNGVETAKENMEVCTDADLFLAYLDSKYGDYRFNEVKREIEEIHNELYKIEKVEWIEAVDDEDEPICQMDIYLTSERFEDYVEANIDMLLTKDEQDVYWACIEVGIYTFRQELASPFVGVDWSDSISDRWGYRVHPITGEIELHSGLDIAMPRGTAINTCMSGTVEIPPFESDGYGKYLKIVNEKGDYTLYGHMDTIAVRSGQEVNTGDVIGYVGRTGRCTGDHLHLEYWRDGQNQNPIFFIECDK